MNARVLLIVWLVVCVIAALIVGQRLNTRMLRSAQKVTEQCDSVKTAAYLAAKASAELGGAPVLNIAGTGSMQPVIPASLPGHDPFTTIVAFAVMQPNAPFSAVEAGDICVYAPSWSTGHNVIHTAVTQEGKGWIMSGLNNEHYEKGGQIMTADNFRGVVAHVFTWPQK